MPITPEQSQQLSRIVDRFLNSRKGTPIDALRRSLGPQRKSLDYLLNANLIRIDGEAYLPTLSGIDEFDGQISKTVRSALTSVLIGIRELYRSDDRRTFGINVVVEATKRQDPTLDQADVLPALILGQEFALYDIAAGIRWGVSKSGFVTEADRFLVEEISINESILDFGSLEKIEEALSVSRKDATLVDTLRPVVEPQSAEDSQRSGAPRTAIILDVLIASPSDVPNEREMVERCIHEWNAVHSRDKGIVLQPVRWETHSYPASGGRPQAIINKQIVDDAHILIGVFGRRLGTPSGEEQSGTIEEIERFRKAGKYVALYFSSGDIPRGADREQLDALEKYQHERQKDTLYGTFNNAQELHQLLSWHLPKIVAHVSNSVKPASDSSTSQREAISQTAPLRIRAQFEREYPDNPQLWLTANRIITLSEIEYLDERDVKIASQRIDVRGQDLHIELSHEELLNISKIKPGTGLEPVPVSFRLHFACDGEWKTEKIPALLVPSYKTINNSSTFFLKLVG